MLVRMSRAPVLLPHQVPVRFVSRTVALICVLALTAGLLALSAVSAGGHGPGLNRSSAAIDDAGDDASNRLAAAGMLARPNDGVAFKGRNIKWETSESNDSPVCHPTHPICVHWTENGTHAPPPADEDNDDIPNQVEATLAAANTSWQTIVGDLGFRAPLPDNRSRIDGGNNKFDIYLADAGDLGIGGYTSSDDRRLTKDSDYEYRDASAVVVVDNDFRDGQFDNNASELDRMRVTVAHELFHASQFAYDHNEDSWFAEGTAAWVEDQVFDSVNLNRSWLKRSPLVRHLDPLDMGRQGNDYGSWIFFRYLSERFGPKFIAQIWRLADDSPAEVSAKRSQTYSMRAVARALKKKDRELPNVFAAFARDSLRTGRAYNEGAAYPRPDVFTYVVDRHSDDTRWVGLSLRHLSSVYASIKPSSDTPRVGSLRVMANGPDLRFHPRYLVTVRLSSGKHLDYSIRLGKNGDGSVKVPFGRKRVDSVDVTMINASARMTRCFSGTALSCAGRAVDEFRNYQLRARLA